MQLAKIEVSDFRGFPGPATYSFDFGSARNLLVWGENGAGKSSLFQAAQQLLRPTSPQSPFSDFKNVFTAQGVPGFVRFVYDDNSRSEWLWAGSRPSDPQIRNLSERSGLINYRELARASGDAAEPQVNIFDLAVNVLLREYPVAAAGAQTTIGRLWRRAENMVPKRRGRRAMQSAANAIAAFNSAVAPIIPTLQKKAQEILVQFPGCASLQLNLQFHNAALADEPALKIAPRQLHVSLALSGRPLGSHHALLNEARLSAVALAIFWAGLIVSVPPPPPGAPSYPRLLVLDDPLVGLDMSNRLAAFEALRSEFVEWQVVLLTHDRIWYDLISQNSGGSWARYEIWAGDAPQGAFEVPVLRASTADWQDLLATAKRHLAGNDPRAAAVYTRAAFELQLKKWCDKHRVPIPFRLEARRLQTSEFLNAATARLRQDPAAWGSISPRLTAVSTCQNVLLNPLSHSTPTNITTTELNRAIAAVENLSLPG